MMHKLRYGIHWLPAIPFFLLAIAFLIIPFANMIVESFKDPETGMFTLNNYAVVFVKPAYFMSTWNSVRISFASTALGMILSFFGALAVHQLGLTSRKWFMPILNISEHFAGFPLAFAFMLMLGNSGFIRLLGELLNIDFIAKYNLYSVNGMLPLFVWFAIPLGTLLLIPGFDAVRKEWREAAELMGANSLYFWFKIGLPNLMPALLGTTSVMFADSITTFSTVLMLMGSNANMLPIRISTMFSGDSKQKTELGSALSVVMIVIILLVMLITNLLTKRCLKGGRRK